MRAESDILTIIFTQYNKIMPYLYNVSYNVYVQMDSLKC